MSFNKKNFIFIVVIYLQIEGYHFECQVKDKATNKRTDCQFPFKFKGKTHNTCIDYIDIKDGEKVPGKPWCSTKVRASDRKHIDGGSHYGNCDSSCPGGVGPDPDGYYYIDDQIMDTDQYEARYGNGSSALSGIAGARYRWPNGVLSYQVSPSISSSHRQQLKRVADRFNREMNGCLEMREQRAKDYVSVVYGGGCSSYVGKSGRGSQPLTLARSGCWRDGTIIHEFIHAWGFYHEQNRHDRDKYVTIHENCLGNRQMAFNFRKQHAGLTFGIPYDGLSIMHYFSTAFSRDGRCKTITSKIPDIPTNRLGTSQWMRDSDRAKLRAMYKCDGTNPPPPPPPPPSGECTANGQKCIFPFKYKGQTYNRCTNVDSPSGAWCALDVDRYGDVIPGEWDDCDSNCDDKPGPTTKRPIVTTRPTTRPTIKPVTDSCSVKEVGTSKTLPCEFPFEFKGRMNYGCITYVDIDINGNEIPVSNGRPWCSTKVSGSERKHVSGGGHYGDCYEPCKVSGVLAPRAPLRSPNGLQIQSCKVKDRATEKLVQCEFPFKFKGVTYDGCIDFIDIKNGTKVPGDPWCSTKVNGYDREHVSGGSHYGNCGSSCPRV